MSRRPGWQSSSGQAVSWTFTHGIGARTDAPTPTPTPTPSPTPTPTATIPSQTGPIAPGAVASVANATASVLTVAKPTGTTTGDVLVACLALNGSGVASGGAPASGLDGHPRQLDYHQSQVAGYYRGRR